MNNNILKKLPSRYVFNGRCGSGGFSDVFFCRDTHLDRKVAIKTIRNNEDINRFNDEIQALLRIRSKHVVQVFDIIRDFNNNPTAIVLEYINGIELNHPQFHISDSLQYLKILWQIATGIADIHNIGLIHRDIKPNNIKIDEEGIVKIFDFGLSRDFISNAKTVGFVGTYGFSAPELYQYNEVGFTQAIDVYAFGITALYLATQNIPESLLQRPPRAVPKDCFDFDYLNDYPILKQLFKQCLCMNSKERPNIDTVKKEIGKFLLIGKHQAILVMKDKEPIVLDEIKKNVKITFGNIGSFEILYDSLSFMMKNATGEVYINNYKVENDCEIKGSCVIGLGSPSRTYRERSFITFDTSSPEVTL